MILSILSILGTGRVCLDLHCQDVSGPALPGCVWTGTATKPTILSILLGCVLSGPSPTATKHRALFMLETIGIGH